MKTLEIENTAIYPEQYELYEKSQFSKPISRRSFFKRMGTGVTAFFVLSDLLASQVLEQLDPDAKSLAEDTIGAWLHIDEAGKITVYTGKVEVGQNIRTSLAQIVAEELFVPVESIEMIMGDTDLTPYDRGTYGSLTTPQMGPKVRKAAASVREMLKDMAAKEWELGKQSLQLEKGVVHHPSNGKKYSYAELAKGKRLIQKVNEDVEVIAPEQWKVAGTSVTKVNGRDFITGKHQYVSDLKLPDMLYGKVLRAPAYGAVLDSIHTVKAKEIPGVTVVEEGDFIGVTAPDSQTAAMALALIEAKWKRTSQPSKKELFQNLKEQSKQEKEHKSNVEEAFRGSKSQLDQTFHIDYIAHVPLEPRAGLAKWEGDKLTVWTGTQRPFGVQEELERTFQISKDKIHVMMPDTGSGYGGKHTGEAGIEAARLSRAVGKPVKVNWTREEEFKWAYFRPAGVIEVKSALGNSGNLASWEFHNYNSGSAGIETPYEVAAKHHQFHNSNSPLRQGSYRALASTANIFAIESQVNDMAAMEKTDPLKFRLQNLKNDRLIAALEATARKFGWDKNKAEGHGYGIACGAVKGGYVATCAEVQVHPTSRELKIIRIVAAFECGAIINPKHLESQVVGCILQGLGGALFEEVDFREGEILNPALSSYRVPRFKDIPELEIVLLDRKDLPAAGAGEAPIVAIAPAIRNAIFDATRVKINRLPMLPNGVVPMAMG